MIRPFLFSLLLVGLSCSPIPSTNSTSTSAKQHYPTDPQLEYLAYRPQEGDRVISRATYADQLYGFWLGQCIANWTGLITEMDKIGGDGLDGKGAGFYTREDWGQPDQPNIWGGLGLDGRAPQIDFFFEGENSTWGADDDTDIEYMYQYLMHQHQTTQLTAEQIRDGWLKHIYFDDNTPFRQANGAPENYLWVSNETAHELMREGLRPPATSDPANNSNYDMIDAQLTTEIFGLFTPTRPEVGVEIARLPIQTTARENAQWIAEFYVRMYALAAIERPSTWSMRQRIGAMAIAARQQLPDSSYAAKMYDFVRAQKINGKSWEEARDALHQRYQVEQADEYYWSTQDKVCNGCFAAGINFGASIVSLLYGEGDIKETIKIGALCGWDSDNPTATWGGMLGFMIGKAGVEEAFGRTFSDRFNIHRTRGGFDGDGIDTFENMAQKGVFIVDRMVQERLGGGVDLERDVWFVPRE
ncbi:MAG: ADP-ribosylglycohydrolase family protein [Bacteroidota bacterium]